jgi:UBX domain-containing protein 1/4
MALRELDSDQALQSFIEQNYNSLITFSATWCGPCRSSKPELEKLANQFHHDTTRSVGFGIVYEHSLGPSIHNYNVRAFPTYALFVNKKEIGRVEGANLVAVRALAEKAGPVIPTTKGYSLGGEGSSSLSLEEARAQRLKKLAETSSAPQVRDEKKDSTTILEDVEMKDTATEPETKETMHEIAALNPESLTILTESMGFSLLRAQKGLLYGESPTVEAAVEWLTLHQDDEDIDDPISAGPVEKVQSYKCNDCGKVLKNMADLELHAHKTGHSDFEESTSLAPTLTPEEKLNKIAEIKHLLKAKRAEREEKEKNDEIEREKQRRFMGKEMAKTQEQLEAEQRKREQWKIKKEKEDFKKERERLRAELAKDKAERIANKGKLGTKLGIDGYKPDGIQYDKNEEQALVPCDAIGNQKKAQASASKIDEYIQRVSSYRAGGDGGKCLKILLAYIGNVLDNPSEAKFRTINTENKAFKTKVKPFVGAKQLLKAVGFKEEAGDNSLVLEESFDAANLVKTREKLKAALDAY